MSKEEWDVVYFFEHNSNMGKIHLMMEKHSIIGIMGANKCFIFWRMQKNKCACTLLLKSKSVVYGLTIIYGMELTLSGGLDNVW